MRLTASLVSLSLLLTPTVAFADGGFEVIVLGALGGIQEGNLSSFLIRPHGDRNAVACDAGSLVNGLRVAQEKGTFRDVKVPEGSTDSVIGHVLKNDIKGYLISHAHLDHIAGLVVASPDDSNKPIYSLPSVGAQIEQTYFNWKAWPNMLDRGQPPHLKKYRLEELSPGAIKELAGTKMTVTPSCWIMPGPSPPPFSSRAVMMPSSALGIPVPMRFRTPPMCKASGRPLPTR